MTSFFMLCATLISSSWAVNFDYYLQKKLYQNKHLESDYKLLKELTYETFTNEKQPHWENPKVMHSLTQFQKQIGDPKLTLKALSVIFILAHENDIFCKRPYKGSPEMIIPNDRSLVTNWNYYIASLVAHIQKDPMSVLNSEIHWLLSRHVDGNWAYWTSALVDLEDYQIIPTVGLKSLVESFSNILRQFKF